MKKACGEILQAFFYWKVSLPFARQKLTRLHLKRSQPFTELKGEKAYSKQTSKSQY